MKRVMTLVAAIIGTSFLGICALVWLFEFSFIMEAIRVGEYYGNVWTAIDSVWGFVAAVPAVIFNALAITAFKCSHENYLKKRSIVITAAAFDFLWALGLLIGFIVVSIDPMLVLMFLAFIAVGVLMLIDMKLENARLAKLDATVTEAAPENAPEKPSEQQK